MEARDTVMSYNYRVMIGLKGKSLDENLEVQAGISFKAGMEKVIKYANQFAGIRHNPEWIATIKTWRVNGKPS